MWIAIGIGQGCLVCLNHVGLNHGLNRLVFKKKTIGLSQ
jgi:hypothetical protein